MGRGGRHFLKPSARQQPSAGCVVKDHDLTTRFKRTTWYRHSMGAVRQRQQPTAPATSGGATAHATKLQNRPPFPQGSAPTTDDDRQARRELHPAGSPRRTPYPGQKVP
jgi:hypothetical protein